MQLELKDIINQTIAAKNITQKDLAEQLGISSVTLSSWANKKSKPRPTILKKLEKLHSESLSIDLLNKKEYSAVVYEEITSGNFDSFNNEHLSEEILKELALLITNKDVSTWTSMIKQLITTIPIGSRIFDWNVGSLVQHFPPIEIINIFKSIPHTQAFYDSIALPWVFGEFKARDDFITKYLKAVIQYSNNSESWWKAAFSLEKLNVEEAVVLLKHSLKQAPLNELDFYLDNLNDKRSVIGILLLCSVENIELIIYPKVKEIFFKTKDTDTMVNCCWLIGRLELLDVEILEKLQNLSRSNNYEEKYYTFIALQNNASEKLRPMLEVAVNDKDPLIRRSAVKALRLIGNEKSLSLLEEALMSEREESVIPELSKAIYFLKNPDSKTRVRLKQKAFRNENGLIIDESDKWYKNSVIYDRFSQAEDPQNICFEIVKNIIKDRKIVNPIDLATGTGRMLWQIMDKVQYEGTIYGVDLSSEMCDYLETAIKRERKFTQNPKIINSDILSIPNKIKEKSSFIISSFGFPSRISDTNLCIKELKAVYELLSDDGIFVTIGWDEDFNDELNEMWYKYIPDSIQAQSFDEWRQIRSSKIPSPRGCSLTWLKKGVVVPLQFSSLDQSATVMGYLFGRDAAEYIIDNNIIHWQMSLGITLNTKSEIREIIKSYEKRN